MMAVGIAALVHDHKPFGPGKVFAEVFFVQNYFPFLWNHTWSLAVEEHFYILIPLVLLLMTRVHGKVGGDPFRRMPVVFACVAGIELALRLLDSRGVLPRLHESHLRFDSLLFGVLLAYTFHFHGTWLVNLCRRWWPFMLLASAVLASPAFVYDTNYFLSTFGLTLLYLSSGLLLMPAVCNGWRFGRIGAFIAWIGAHSYSIYIWHMFVLFHGVDRFRTIYQNHYGHPPPWLMYVAMIALQCTVFGIIMAKAVEYPVLFLRDRWFPARSVAAVERVADIPVVMS
jgi:peptidoglycan/LPS O-acetylase OafA/YrhL